LSIELLYNYLNNKDKLIEDNSDELVPIEEWVNNPYYVGDINIYPFWKKVIIDFYNGNKNSIIFTGSTRSGKSFIAYLLIIRKLYELSEYRRKYGSASLKFGLDESSNISILILSAKLETAERESISVLRRMIDNIEYFNCFMPRNDKLKSLLSFDDDRIQVRAVSSYVRSLLGTNMICVMLDEMNFIRGEKSGFYEALELYSEATSRIEQTFSIGDGKNYGFKILISSADTSDSFVENMIEKEKKNVGTMIINAKRYEITPEKFSDKKVYLFRGDKNMYPFFVDEEEKDKYKNLLEYLGVDNIEEYLNYNSYEDVKIPDMYKHLFEYIPINFYNKSIDITRILRDVCGISIGSYGNFFNNLNKFNSCISYEIENPFYENEIVCSSNNSFNELISNLKDDFWGDKDKTYSISLDLSKRYDSTGIAMGYYDNKKDKIIINMMLKVNPPENKNFSIKFKAIQEFIEYLIHKRKFNIVDFYCDGYQSDYFIEHFSNMRINTKKVSVEGEKEYLVLKDSILEEKILFYENDIFKKELFGLIHNVNKKRVDHPEDGNKDLSDAVCRLIYMLLIKYDVVSSNSNIIGVLSKLVNNENRLNMMNRKEVLDLEMKKYNAKKILKGKLII